MANPHCEKRMQMILQQMMNQTSEKVEIAEKEQEDDEVSFVYYGDTCTCSKLAKCRSSKCLCYLRGNKCTPKCHNDSNGSGKCTNS